MADPVFHHDGGAMRDDGSDVEPEGWYFWNEDWASYQGPWPTEPEARAYLAEYVKWLNNEPNDLPKLVAKRGKLTQNPS